MSEVKTGKDTPVRERKAGKCGVKIKRLPVEHVAEYAFCKCEKGGEMVWVTEGTIDIEGEEPEGIPHKCEECGMIEFLDRIYPDVRTYVKFKGKTEEYNCGNIKECDCDGE